MESYVKDTVPIGQIFILPLWWELHDVRGRDDFNVTHNRMRFQNKYGLQKYLFQTMCQSIEDQGITLPFSEHVMAAIMATKY